jgi:hypothetical protein
MTARTASFSAAVRRFALPACLLTAAVVAACGDLSATTAQYANSEIEFYVYSLTGSPPPKPTALAVQSLNTTRPDGSLAFDVAFDLDAAGNVTLLPVKMIGLNVSGSRSVGIQKVAGAYGNITEAPKTGYTVDSVTVVRVGEPVVLQVQTAYCSTSYTPDIYAKMVVDSIAADGRIWARALVNTNCGFRQLLLGFPSF